MGSCCSDTSQSVSKQNEVEQPGSAPARRRIAIIGSGPCGLMQLCAFKNLEGEVEEMPEIVCFEKQDKVCGLWNYDWRTGVDKNGEAVHNSMYKQLWSNGPKECLEFPDYSFEQHFGAPVVSYPPRLALRDYIIGYTKHHKVDLDSTVRLNSSVQNVEFLDELS